MTNLRERAAEVKAAGVAERGNFTPPDFAKKIYAYWLRHSRSNKAALIRLGQRENLCHFGRVVLFWAPLMLVRRGVVKVVEHPVFQVLVGLASIAIVITAITKTGSWLILLYGLLGAVGLVILGGILVFLGIKAKDWIAAHWNHDWDSKIDKVLQAIVGLSFIVGIVFALTMLAIHEGIGMLAMVLGAAVLMGIFVFAMSKFIEYLSGKRALAKAKQREVMESWTEEQWEEHYSQTREPGKISKFFTAIGDMLIFIGQTIRVKKWKICPLVEIES